MLSSASVSYNNENVDEGFLDNLSQFLSIIFPMKYYKRFPFLFGSEERKWRSSFLKEVTALGMNEKMALQFWRKEYGRAIKEKREQGDIH